ncbi:NAD(P)/FAD-dependent oxidoreductase [Paracoccus onubensis]|uniref:FAD-dependent oxidoreductase n=1 Tax=Paracoccus onubensis TaxID=1675788 RepID=A0A418SY68_9RHOB|nr:FAD-dependent oxidoreductase [Paracoccus onubensis]RJE85850.1 FAD-dependent oxidoreductase [Paracoccus onubensis]
MSGRDQFVIIGASLAGLRAAEALREYGYDGNISIIGAENSAPYNRPPLSKQLLTGQQDFDELTFPVAEDLDLNWYLGISATGLDIAKREVKLSTENSLRYDRLLIATGVDPIVPPLPNVDLPGIHVLRRIEDAKQLRTDMNAGDHLVIVGAGFIGCEVAASARTLGLDVTIIDQADQPMARALPSEIAQVFRHIHEEEGVRFRFGRTVTGLTGEDRVRAVILDDGETIDADHILIGIGSRPTTHWLEGSGLILRNGVVCDAFCRAMNGEGRVAAAGDVAVFTHRGYNNSEMRIEHWTNAAQQGAAAALSLMDEHSPPYTPLPSFWTDQYSYKLQSIGVPGVATRFQVVSGSLADRKFLVECLKDDELVGVFALNMAPRMASYRRRMEIKMTQQNCQRS